MIRVPRGRAAERDPKLQLHRRGDPARISSGSDNHGGNQSFFLTDPARLVAPLVCTA